METEEKPFVFVYPRHLVASQQFDLVTLRRLFASASQMRTCGRVFSNKIIATLFYEPSTRTRFSFESAALRLGAGVISTENARLFSSAAKGETIEDTIRVTSGYADLAVIRHDEEGGVAKAAAVDAMPVINAGDGVGQHPTQALLDVYTILDHFGHVDGLTIALMGDLANGRTVRSLCYLLARYQVKKLIFIAPPVVAMRADIKEYLVRHGVAFEEQSDLLAVVDDLDVLYQTRIQKERFGDRLDLYAQASGHYIVDLRVANMMKEEAIIMHPLPRMGEILPGVDDNPRAKYFKQAENGLYVRMAILYEMLAATGKPAGLVPL